MRHGKKFNHLGRKSAHRKATLRNLAIALFTHKRINTTLAKAKALRVFAEPIITRSKTNDTHNRRQVFASLGNKEIAKELFDEIGPKVANRPGGYLRIIKTGFRQGDAAEMAMIEFVDYNDTYSKEATKSKGRTRRSRRRKKSSGTTAAATTAATTAAVADVTPAPPAAEEE